MGIQVVTVLCLLIILWAIISLIRNNMVYHFRARLLYSLYNQVVREKDYDQWKRNIKKFESVSYHEMVYKFWKPIKSFYKMEDFGL
jgi:hypothetical protein